MSEFQTIQSNIIDGFLQKSPYMSKLSVADRIAVYNEALKRLSEVRNYIYENVTDSGNRVAINMDYMTLSNLKTIDNIMENDLIDLTLEERLLIYNITQFRIASLRIIQKQSHYAVSNVRSTYISSLKKFVVPILSNITLIGIFTSHEKLFLLPIEKSIIAATVHLKEKFLELPLTKVITDILGQTKIKNIAFPISNSIAVVNINAFIKYLTMSLSTKIIGSDPIIPLITVSLEMLTIGSQSGNTNIYINSNIAWTVSSNRSWIRPSGSGAIGNSNITINWDANTSSQSRDVSITITGVGASKVISITQAGTVTVPEIKWLNQLKNIVFPINKNIVEVQAYQHIKTKELALPLSKTIVTIG